MQQRIVPPTARAPANFLGRPSFPQAPRRKHEDVQSIPGRAGWQPAIIVFLAPYGKKRKERNAAGMFFFFLHPHKLSACLNSVQNGRRSTVEPLRWISIGIYKSISSPLFSFFFPGFCFLPYFCFYKSLWALCGTFFG